MRRGGLMVLALVLVQGLLLGGWWLIEDRRGGRSARATVTFEPTQVPAPELLFSRRDGSSATLSQESERVVVHFWATWCLPCREELPSLLSWSERSGVELLAVSVDPTWDAVERFLEGPPSPAIVLADPEAARSWGADGLPTTFVVEGGAVKWVARGPVDWGKHARFLEGY